MNEEKNCKCSEDDKEILKLFLFDTYFMGLFILALVVSPLEAINIFSSRIFQFSFFLVVVMGVFYFYIQKLIDESCKSLNQV